MSRTLRVDLTDREGAEHYDCRVLFAPGHPATWDEPAEGDEVDVVSPAGLDVDPDHVADQCRAVLGLPWLY